MYKVVHPRSWIHVRVSRSFEAWTRYLCTRRSNGSLVSYVTRVVRWSCRASRFIYRIHVLRRSRAWRSYEKVLLADLCVCQKRTEFDTLWTFHAYIFRYTIFLISFRYTYCIVLYCIVFYSTVLQIIIIIINYYISRRVLRCRVWICFVHRDSTRLTCRRHLDQLYFETTSIIKQRRFFILDRVINEHVPHLGKHACSLPVNG